jgi:multidrug efflux system membrane fusion protein
MTVDLRTIVVERQSDDTTVVRNGLKTDEIVVTDGQLRLVPGVKVSIKTEPKGTSSKVEP